MIRSLQTCKKIFKVVDYIPKIIINRPDALKPTSVKGHIKIEDITFAYPSKPDVNVFENTSVEIPAGKSAAFVGLSGSGKTTLIRLIQRFYDVNSGRIKLDGNDIKDLEVTWLHHQIGFVDQEPALFTGTIEENIAYCCDKYTEEDMDRALEMANVKEFLNDIKKFPKGLQTRIGGINTQLSGGQKQRITIARALLKKPKILILDEVTSSLDGESEQLVQEAVDSMMESEDTTIILISHRLSTIVNCRKIFVLENGSLAETGSHKELVAKDGVYKKLFAKQMINLLDDNDGASESSTASTDSEKDIITTA